MTLTGGNWITIAVIALTAVAGVAMFEAEVISFERFTEKREAQIWERVDKQEVEITDLKTRVSVIEALMKAKE